MESVKNFFKKIPGFITNFSLKNSSTNTKIIGLCVIILIILGIVIYIRNQNNDKLCKLLQQLYDTKPPLISVVDSPTQSVYSLRDFYIKTAYNCCCLKKDAVDLCALSACIGQGARCLDFQIYANVNDNKPVVAISPIDSYKINASDKYISIEKVLTIINNQAFSSGTCPNFNDPLILHFRISSNNIDLYNNLADDIRVILNQRVLGPEYSNQYNNRNLGALPISTFNQKIIVMIDASNPIYRKTKLFEYINAASGTPFLHLQRYNQIKYTQDLNLANFNKENMTIVLPDLRVSNKNPNFNIPNEYGCQMLGMSFWNSDENLTAYNNFFNAARFAFALKPEKLRYVQATINIPNPLPKEYSYSPRKISGDFYNFQI